MSGSIDLYVSFPLMEIRQDPLKVRHDLTFREYRPEDSTRVSEIICRCLRETNSKDYSPAEIERMLPGFAPEQLTERFANQATVVIQGEEIAGVGILAGTQIQTVFVDPSLHGRKIGQKLMDHLERVAKTRGITEIGLFASITSRDFYAHRGYEEIREVVHPIGGKMFEMKKKVGS